MSGWHMPSWVMATRWVGLGVIGLVLVGGLVLSAWTTTQKRRTSGAVVGIVGRMGSGKSYAAVRLALDRMGRGVDVCSNFHIDVRGLNVPGKWRPFTGWDMFAELRDCVVIVDEAHLYAPSHQHINFPMLARWALAHGRKHGLDVYWISQHEDRVNRTLRDLTTAIALSESYFGGKFFRLTYWAPEDVRKPKKHMFRRWYRLDRRIADRYDTRATIEVDEYSLKGDKSAAKLRDVQRSPSVQRSGSKSGGESPVGGPPPPEVGPVVGPPAGRGWTNPFAPDPAEVASVTAEIEERLRAAGVTELGRGRGEV